MFIFKRSVWVCDFIHEWTCRPRPQGGSISALSEEGPFWYAASTGIMSSGGLCWTLPLVSWVASAKALKPQRHQHQHTPLGVRARLCFKSSCVEKQTVRGSRGGNRPGVLCDPHGHSNPQYIMWDSAKSDGPLASGVTRERCRSGVFSLDPC